MGRFRTPAAVRGAADMTQRLSSRRHPKWLYLTSRKDGQLPCQRAVLAGSIFTGTLGRWLSEIPHSEGTWQRISTRDTAWPSLYIGLSVADRVHIREVKGGLHAGFPEDPLSNRHVG